MRPISYTKLREGEITERVKKEIRNTKVLIQWSNELKNTRFVVSYTMQTVLRNWTLVTNYNFLILKTRQTNVVDL